MRQTDLQSLYIMAAAYGNYQIKTESAKNLIYFWSPT